jgi:carbon storage regulator CsrA
MNFAIMFSAQRLLPGGNAMLVLSRKPGEKLVIGHEIIVTVLEVRGSQVKIGIEAPDNVKIIRAELKAAQPDATRRRCVGCLPFPGRVARRLVPDGLLNDAQDGES